MPSLIPGYRYDIFISYRQKDNKGDHWVTEFVNALKTELEATFKEDVSIYFDENPHDGLLDTHVVDKSLSEKLNCLIFIPVLSQTYCDPHSFAWEHEFCAFDRLSREDALGRDIRLANGNVASRILPVRIHELDPEDTNRVESETGTKLRCIDFVFKSPGVNRPLRASEDHPHDNLNKTYYRDQINKVANAVKEIIHSMKDPQSAVAISREAEQNNSQVVPERRKRKAWAWVALLVVMAGMAAGIHYLVNPSSESKTISSIAVLPFRKISLSPENEFLADAITEAVIGEFYKVRAINTRSAQTVQKYKDTNKTIPEIAQELKVEAVLSGSVTVANGTARVQVSLVDAQDNLIWSNPFEYPLEDILKLQKTIALTVTDEVHASLAPTEMKAAQAKVERVNPAAYAAYMQGRKSISNGEWNAALESFKKSVELDSTFAEAWGRIAHCYISSSTRREREVEEAWKLAKPYNEKARELNPNLVRIYLNEVIYYRSVDDWDNCAQALKKAIQLAPNDPDVLASLETYFVMSGQNQEAVEVSRRLLGVEPYEPRSLANLRHALYFNREFEACLEVISIQNRLSPGNYDREYLKAINHAFLKQCDSTYASIQRYMQLKGYTGGPAQLPYTIWLYGKCGYKDKAKSLLEQEKATIAQVKGIDKLFLYLGIKSDEEVLDLLDSLIQSKKRESAPGAMVLNMASSPALDHLRDHPRFVAAKARIRFPEKLSLD